MGRVSNSKDNTVLHENSALLGGPAVPGTARVFQTRP